jgi:RNA polymerase-interacting CarD/CdnL/TRCF family regulator
MTNETKQTAVEWYSGRVHDIERLLKLGAISITEYYEELTKAVQQAKEMEKEQIGYSKEDVLTAGEMGEINTHDTKHIVSYLDEAKQFNIRR